MANDEDVLIKVAADIASAVAALGTLLDQFKSIGETLKAVDASAEGTSSSMEQMASVITESISSIAPALDAVSQNLGGLVESLNTALSETTTAGQTVTDTMTTMATASGEAQANLSAFAEGGTEALGQTKTAAEGLSEEFSERLAPSAEDVEAATGPLFEGLEDGTDTLEDAGDAARRTGDDLGGYADAVEQANAQQLTFLDTTDESVTRSFRLGEAISDLKQKREDDAAAIASLTETERAHILTLIEAGQSYKDVAEASGLSTEALRELQAQEQAAADAAEAAKGPVQSFFEALLGGFNASQAAAVTWGQLMADAFQSLGEGLKKAAMAIPNMVSEMADAGDELQTMANRLGITAAEVAELNYIADLSGANMNVMAKSLQTLSGQLLDTTSKAAKAVISLGLMPEALAKIEKESGKGAALAAIVEQIKAVVPAAEQGAKMIEIFGNRAQQMTVLLKENLPEIHEEFANLVDEEAINKAGVLGDAFNDSFVKLDLIMTNFNRKWTNEVIKPVNKLLEVLIRLVPEPILAMGAAFKQAASDMVPFLANVATMAGGGGKDVKYIFELFGDGAEAVKKFGKSAVGAGSDMAKASVFTQGFGASMKQLSTGIGSMASGMVNFIKGIPGMVAGFASMTGAVLANTAAMLTNPWVLAAAALAALGVAVYNMIGGWEGLVKVFNKVVEAIQPLLTFFTDLGTILLFVATESFAILWNWVSKAWQSFISFFTEVENGKTKVGRLIEIVMALLAEFKKFPGVELLFKAIKIQVDALVWAIVGMWDLVKRFFAFIGRVTHETADQIRELNKTKEESAAADKKRADAAPKPSDMDKLSAATAKLNAAYKSLTASQKKAITEAKAAGLGTKDIAEGLKDQFAAMGLNADEVQKVVDRYLTSVDKAKQAAEKDPFTKMMKSATELAAALKKATAAGWPLEAVIEEFGSKASEIYKQAALSKALDKIDQNIITVAKSFEQAQVDGKLLKANRAAAELAATLRNELVEAVRASSEAVQNMADEMEVGMLTGSAARMKQLDIEDRRVMDSLSKRSIAADADQQKKLRAIDEIAKKETLAAAKETDPAAKEKRLAEIEESRQAQIAAAIAVNAAVQQGLVQEQAMHAKNAEYKRALEAKTTGDYEKDAALRGVITKQAAAEELAEEQKKLASMQDIKSNATAFEVEEQQRKIALLQDAAEQDAQARGLITLKQRELEIEKEEDALAAMKKDRTKYYAWEISAKERNVQQMRNAAEKEAKALGLVTKQAQQEQVIAEQVKLKHMLDNSALYTKEQIRQQKEITQSAEREASAWRQAWEHAISKATELLGGLGQAFTDIGETVGSPALKNIGKAFDFGVEVLGAVQGLLEAKDAIGAIIAAAKLAAVAIKGMWDMFTTSKGEKAQKEISRNFKNAYGEALKVTEEFGDEIAKTAEDMFKGDRFAAQVYRLNDVIEEAGGLSTKNFASMTARLGDVFGQVAKGTFTLEQATETLDKNFGAFAKHVVDSGRVASASFTAILEANDKFGTKSKEIMDFVQAQTTRLGGALTKLMGPYAKLSELTAELGKATDKADIDRLSGEIAKVKGELGDTNVAMARFERLAVAGFNAAIKSGASYIDAMEAMGPALDQIVQSHKDLGTAAGPAIEELLRFREVASSHKELVDSAGSLNEIMLALSNIGGLNVETMADLQAQGAETFAALQAAGFSEAQSLQQMKGYLEQVRNAHRDLGLPIDENTQKLIDQAEEQGILRAEQMSTNDIMLQGLGAIIEALGGKLPEAFQKTAKAGVDSAKQITEGFGKGVNPTILATDKHLKETGWAGYAGKAVVAGKLTADAMGGAKGAIKDIDAQLSQTEWEAWAEAAVEAAKRAKDAMEATAHGESPGGIREISTRLKAAMVSASEWEKSSVMSAGSVKDAMETVTSAGVASAATAAPGARGGGGSGITIEEGAIYIDRPIMKDRQAMEELTLDIAKKLKTVLNPRGAW